MVGKQTRHFQEYDGPDRRVTEHWRLDKKITVGEIFATMMFAGTLVTVYVTLDKRVLTLENSAIAQIRADEVREGNAREARQAIADQIRVMSEGMRGLQSSVSQLQISVAKVEAGLAIVGNPPGSPSPASGKK